MKNTEGSIKHEIELPQSDPEEDGEGVQKVALVLGGGGARGFAHLGVVKVLQELGLKPDMIVGTSMGSVIGSAAAGEVEVEGLIKVLERLDINQILQISRESRRELEKVLGRTLAQGIGVSNWGSEESNETPVKLARFFTFFKLLTKNSDIAELPVIYAAVATDLLSGSEVILTEGKVYRAAAASSAIPGFIPPVKWEDFLLVDGGVVDTVPVLPAVQLGADAVIAVDVSTNLPEHGSNSPLAIFNRTSKIRKEELLKAKNAIARVQLPGMLKVLSPQVDDLNWLDFNQIKKAASRGERCIRKDLDEVKSIFNSVKN
ncbi:patatin-like phospholipase family protein [Candidatus Bipolaricaulota bacterium]|nr:patatin-like phospholipase family protein [Candidatus Bipolaricaulota bacterium]